MNPTTKTEINLDTYTLSDEYIAFVRKEYPQNVATNYEYVTFGILLDLTMNKTCCCTINCSHDRGQEEGLLNHNNAMCRLAGFCTLPVISEGCCYDCLIRKFNTQRQDNMCDRIRNSGEAIKIRNSSELNLSPNLKKKSEDCIDRFVLSNEEHEFVVLL